MLHNLRERHHAQLAIAEVGARQAPEDAPMRHEGEDGLGPSGKRRTEREDPIREHVLRLRLMTSSMTLLLMKCSCA